MGILSDCIKCCFVILLIFTLKNKYFLFLNFQNDGRFGKWGSSLKKLWSNRRWICRRAARIGTWLESAYVLPISIKLLGSRESVNMSMPGPACLVTFIRHRHYLEWAIPPITSFTMSLSWHLRYVVSVISNPSPQKALETQMLRFIHFYLLLVFQWSFVIFIAKISATCSRCLTDDKIQPTF